MNYARENVSCEASVSRGEIYACGAFKNVYRGEYTSGVRAGEECVSKEFKSGSVYAASYFDSEMKIFEKTLEIINKFNRSGLINKNIWLNQPAVWTYTQSQAKCLVEPFIENFEKFNSNSGWTPRESSNWIDVMQALSHFSYHTTNRHLVLCDLQGGVYKDGFIITDPVIMSTTSKNHQEYGPTDLGYEGISTFFSNHVCSRFCHSDWMSPVKKVRYFPIQQGTSMALTRNSRATLPY